MDASEKYGYRLVHTTPNYHPPKMDVLLKTFLQIIHAAKSSMLLVPQTAATTYAFSSACFFYGFDLLSSGFFKSYLHRLISAWNM